MKFGDLQNVKEIYDNFIADARNYNYDDVDQAMDDYWDDDDEEADFENYILSLDIRADKANEIRERALLLGSTFEQQGFFYG